MILVPDSPSNQSAGGARTTWSVSVTEENGLKALLWTTTVLRFCSVRPFTETLLTRKPCFSFKYFSTVGKLNILCYWEGSILFSQVSIQWCQHNSRTVRLVLSAIFLMDLQLVGWCTFLSILVSWISFEFLNFFNLKIWKSFRQCIWTCLTTLFHDFGYHGNTNIIFTCAYLKLRWNTTALSQSNCRNFSCSSIKNNNATGKASS